MDDAARIDENPPIAVQAGVPAASADDLSWAVVKMRAVERIIVNEPLIAAYQAASSPHSIRALKSDLEAFDLWCRRHNRVALPATPETVADYLDARAEKGSKPASLGRYKASIAKIHMLLDLKDPTPASLVKLRLQAIRRRLGTAQKQARPLRFKGPVRNVERDDPRGLNVRALLENCGDDLPGLRNRRGSGSIRICLRAARILPASWTHCGGNLLVCRFPITGIWLRSTAPPGG